MATFIAEIDINKGLSDIWGLDPLGDVFLLLRTKQRPLAILYIQNIQKYPMGVLTKERIEQEIESQLGIPPQLFSCFPQNGFDHDHHAEISVVVCTRDRPRSLRICLEALAQLQYEKYEVVVVDNASKTGETRNIVESSPFRYIREDQPGLDWARNRGIAEATHDIIAFVDDDARVDPYWLAGMAKAFSNSHVGAATGLVLPAELATYAQHLFQIYSNGMSKGLNAKWFDPSLMISFQLIKVQDVGVGTNMAFRREVINALGGFDTALDVGTLSRGGGDLDMFHRVLVSGRTIRYEPEALVWHYDRRDMDNLRHQLYNNGRAFGVYLLKLWKQGSVSRARLAYFVFFQWYPWLVGRLVLRLMRRHRLPFRLLWAEFWGSLHSPWAYIATYYHDRRVHRKNWAPGKILPTSKIDPT
jgi:glycosyltransferase involved in cell wall biosynthesis